MAQNGAESLPGPQTHWKYNVQTKQSPDVLLVDFHGGLWATGMATMPKKMDTLTKVPIGYICCDLSQATRKTKGGGWNGWQ